MKKHLTFIAALGSLLLIPPFSAATFPEFSPQNNPLISQQTPAQSVQQIAKSITVKILLSDTNGSGVIITKKGQTYTVLTNAHVVTRSKSYRIQTPDGNTHLAVLKKQGSSLNGDDLAILEFQSDRNYALASFGNSTNLIQNETVFSAGFPVNQNNLNFLSSHITLIATQPLKGGYQIGYTNQTEQGMSGGALLNQKGQLIGIIGMGTGAVLNEAYQYQNGSFPPKNLLSQMRKISFAVPLNTL
ncbi:MAG TPA: serine protease, partial [Allocoleopsis sp.]